jgi:hypothetical protein
MSTEDVAEFKRIIDADHWHFGYSLGICSHP